MRLELGPDFETVDVAVSGGRLPQAVLEHVFANGATTSAFDDLRNIWCPQYDTCLNDMVRAEKTIPDMETWRCNPECPFRQNEACRAATVENVRVSCLRHFLPDDPRAVQRTRAHQSSALSSASTAR